MSNIIVKLTATEVKEILEAHLNNTLLETDKVQANVTQVLPQCSPSCEPGQPNQELVVTFNAVKG